MKLTRHILLSRMLVTAVLGIAPSAWTQQITGDPSVARATEVISGKQIPAPPLPFGGVLKESVKDSKFGGHHVWYRPKGRLTCCSS
jgi:hypothetical protein